MKENRPLIVIIRKENSCVGVVVNVQSSQSSLCLRNALNRQHILINTHDSNTPSLLPSAMISSTVTWCRPIVNARPMKFPPAWLEPLPPPAPPEPGPELTNSRRESKNFLMMSIDRRYYGLKIAQMPFLLPA